MDNNSKFFRTANSSRISRPAPANVERTCSSYAARSSPIDWLQLDHLLIAGKYFKVLIYIYFGYKYGQWGHVSGFPRSSSCSSSHPSLAYEAQIWHCDACRTPSYMLESLPLSSTDIIDAVTTFLEMLQAIALAGRFTSNDIKSVKSICSALSRLDDSFHDDQDRLQEICSTISWQTC